MNICRCFQLRSEGIDIRASLYFNKCLFMFQGFKGKKGGREEETYNTTKELVSF